MFKLFQPLHHRLNLWIGRLGYEVIRILSLVSLKLGFQFQIVGSEYLKSSSTYILAGNHAGLLDSLILVAACPSMLYFLMERSVYQWAMVGPFLRLFPNIVPIRQAAPRNALDAAARILSQHHSLVIFPEGQLTRDGRLNAFKPGVLRLQDASRLPILPFSISGGFEAWGWGKSFPQFHPIRLTFHKPIPFLPMEKNNMEERLVRLQRQVASAL